MYYYKQTWFLNSATSDDINVRPFGSKGNFNVSPIINEHAEKAYFIKASAGFIWYTICFLILFKRESCVFPLKPPHRNSDEDQGLYKHPNVLQWCDFMNTKTSKYSKVP